MLRRAVIVVLVASGIALVGVGPAEAAVTSTIAGNTATVSGDAASNSFEIGVSGGLLTLNGSFDWDTTAPGDQTLADAASSSVVINAGDDVDILSLGAPGTALASHFTFNGQAGADFVFVYPGGSGADAVTVTGNSVSGPDVGQLAWDNTTDQVNVRTGNGADVVTVAAASTSPQLFVYAEGGDDTLKLANGTALSSSPGTESAFRGGPGTDTVDYSAWTTPVSVDLGRTAKFHATLTKGNVVPPSASTATADAEVDFTDLASNTFTYEVDLDGSTAALITDAHIHQGAVGANGPVVLTIGSGLSWSNPQLPAGTSPSTESSPMTDPDITEAALRAGNTYVDVHMAAGDIRGQLTLDPDDGYGGSGTGVPRLLTVENVIGGSGNDILKGSIPHNSFDCGPGQDTVTADATDTLVRCDKGGTGSITPLKPKAKAKGKKVTIDTGATASCPATAPSACTVSASATGKLGKKAASFGTLSAAPAAGTSTPIVLKVPKKTAKAWRKAGKAKITFTVTITVPDGTSATVTATVKLRPPKAPKAH